METFFALLAICEGNSSGTRTKASDAELRYFLWINGWVNNREAGDLRRNHDDYDVTVMITSDLVVWSSSMNARPWYLQGDIIGDTTVLCSVIDKIESMKIKPQCNIIVLKTGLVTYMMSSLYLTQPWLIIHHKENPVLWHCSLPDTDRSVHKQNCAFKRVVHDIRFIDVAKSSNVAKSNVSPDLTLQRKISAVSDFFFLCGECHDLLKFGTRPREPRVVIFLFQLKFPNLIHCSENKRNGASGFFFDDHPHFIFHFQQSLSL